MRWRTSTPIRAPSSTRQNATALPTLRKRTLDANDARWEEREEVCIDFSVLFDAQDYDEAELERTLTFAEEVNGDAADVLATFSLFGTPREILWSLDYDNGSWKVTDISSPEAGWRLSELHCE